MHMQKETTLVNIVILILMGIFMGELSIYMLVDMMRTFMLGIVMGITRTGTLILMAMI